MNRITEKIKEIDNFIENLKSYVPETLEEYINDSKTKHACERCFEKIVEALADLSFLVIKEKNLEKARDDIDAFSILSKNKIITKELSEKLKDAKGMRNIISHEYGKVDDAKVFQSVKEEIILDSQEFLENIEKAMS